MKVLLHWPTRLLRKFQWCPRKPNQFEHFESLGTTWSLVTYDESHWEASESWLGKIYGLFKNLKTVPPKETEYRLYWICAKCSNKVYFLIRNQSWFKTVWQSTKKNSNRWTEMSRQHHAKSRKTIFSASNWISGITINSSPIWVKERKKEPKRITQERWTLSFKLQSHGSPGPRKERSGLFTCS